MSYEFIPVGTDDKAIKEVAELLRLVFPNSAKYSAAFIEWQYRNNPEGEVVGYNAYENGVLAAHYALIPFKATLFGNEEMGLLSLNTATHPNHQGKKLFTSLADLSYISGVKKGYGFVIGVANANSTPGFVYKLGFQLVGALDAKLGYGKISSSEKSDPIHFIKNWDRESLEWRLANPEMQYKIKNNVIYAATDKFGIEALLLDTSNLLPMKDNGVNLGFRPIKLWIGIDHSIRWGRHFYFNIPESIRPSPLNLIFKDLNPKNRNLELENVRFTAFDFDAY